MLKAVIDTNVWVSGLLTHGKPREVLNRFENGLFTISYPPELIDELRKIPNHRKLASRISTAELENIIALIELSGTLITIGHVPPVSRDPNDDIFLACAVSSHSDFLITGDNDLLDLKTQSSTEIVTPAAFLEILTTQS